MMRNAPDGPGGPSGHNARERSEVPMHPQNAEDIEQDKNIVRLTRAQAEQLFGPGVSRPSQVTPLKVVAAQVVLSLVVSLAWYLWSSHPGQAALSALLGGAVCWFPSLLFALRLKSASGQTAGALVVGAAIKMGVTLAMFAAIAFYYREVLWLPLLVTYLVALKTYWLALAFK